MRCLHHAAADGGHLPLLKLLLERHRPWGEGLVFHALYADNSDCVVAYLLDQELEREASEDFIMDLLIVLLDKPSGPAGIQILYDRGYLPRSGQLWASIASEPYDVRLSPGVSWACLKVTTAALPPGICCPQRHHPLMSILIAEVQTWPRFGTYGSAALLGMRIR